MDEATGGNLEDSREGRKIKLSPPSGKFSGFRHTFVTMGSRHLLSRGKNSFGVTHDDFPDSLRVIAYELLGSSEKAFISQQISIEAR
jgi:hypothetical protein